MKKIILYFLLISFLFQSKSVIAADNDPVPYKTQVKIFLKIINYLENLKSIKKINIGVVFNNSNFNSIKSKDLIYQHLKKTSKILKNKKVNIILIEEKSISSIDNEKIDIIYFVDKLSLTNKIHKIAKEMKILSWSSEPNKTRNGFSSISIFEKNNKPKIIINLYNSEKEGHKINKRLLNISKVVN